MKFCGAEKYAFAVEYADKHIFAVRLAKKN